MLGLGCRAFGVPGCGRVWGFRGFGVGPALGLSGFEGWALGFRISGLGFGGASFSVLRVPMLYKGCRLESEGPVSRF